VVGASWSKANALAKRVGILKGRKQVKAMTYNKPEILVLGEASQTIQQLCEKPPSPFIDPNVCGGGMGSSYDVDD
jgi:hypothetical protein